MCGKHHGQKTSQGISLIPWPIFYLQWNRQDSREIRL
jgi:hypothetical protein